MDEKLQKKMEMVDNLANQDPLYQYLLEEGKLLEERFDEMTAKLSYKRRDIAWDFVMHCEEMSRRKLELACSLIPDGSAGEK